MQEHLAIKLTVDLDPQLLNINYYSNTVHCKVIVEETSEFYSQHIGRENLVNRLAVVANYL